MNRVTLVNLGLTVLNVVLAAVFLLTLAALVEARSQDIVRITVKGSDLLPTVRQLQGATGKVAYAYPVGRPNNDPNAMYWRLVIDNRSESIK